MISTYTTSSIISTTITPNSVVTAPVSPSDIMVYGIIIVITLIAFLALKLILSSKAHENAKITRFVDGTNVAILPLTYVFLLTVVIYQIILIL